jgi:agmatinase
MRLPHVQDLEQVDFAVMGVPFDTGSSLLVGSRFGPEAIRSASVILKPCNYFHEVTIFDFLSGVDYGDLPVVPGYHKESNVSIKDALLPVIKRGVTPILLGGDHSITLPELQAIHQVHGPVGLIHFDSHSDTNDQYYGQSLNHGTPFRRAVEEGLLDVGRSIQVGLRGTLYREDDLDESRDLGFDIVNAVEAHEMGMKALAEKIKQRAGQGPVFVTFDIDFVDPAFAPGTGTREVGGFTSAQTLEVIRGLTGLDFVGFDVVEVLPAIDPSGITALLAANIAYEFISLLAWNRKFA